jgi:hypothetical protein
MVASDFSLLKWPVELEDFPAMFEQTGEKQISTDTPVRLCYTPKVDAWPTLSY